MKYRPDIDGLRAIAVLSVILFHAGVWPFTGGFVGVDIFFVISGFLITTLIQRDLARGTFSLSEFYERRARRILPMLFLVVVVTFIAAAFILYPNDMEDFGESVISIPLFLSNVLFWDQSGYFDTAAELKPLLHTWSLAVEEQFYIFFPLLLMALWRFGLGVVLAVLALLFVASLGYAHWASSEAPDAAFFLIMSRAWELIVGAFAAFALVSRPSLRELRIGPALAAVGLISAVVPIFAFDSETPTPGLAFLIPMFGTALILLFSNSGGLAFAVLAARPMVWIGLLSYSAYLWHQPLFAFTRYKTVLELPLWQAGGLILITILLADLSLRFVEAPFRNRDFLTRQRVFKLSGTSLFALLLLGLVADKTDGLPYRFDGGGLPFKGPIACHSRGSYEKLMADMDTCLGTEPDGIAGTIFLLGDSHAAQLTFPLEKLAQARGVDLRFMNAHENEFFPYTFIQEDDAPADALLARVMKLAEPGDILVFTIFRSRLNDVYLRQIPLDQEAGPTEKGQRFESNMRRVLPDLKAAGLKVVFVEDTPFLNNVATIERCVYNQDWQEKNGCAVTFAQDAHDRTQQSEIFQRLADEFPDFVRVIDPLPTIYGGAEKFLPVASDGFLRMRDRHHLTVDEAKRLLPFFEANLP